VPLCGNSSQRPHGALSNDGDRNILDSVDYIVSGIWKGADGKDTVGGVAVLDELIFHAREVQKGDARPGGYVATGGHGGVVGTIGQPGPPVLTFRPARLHTHRSLVRLPLLPAKVQGVHRAPIGIEIVEVAVKDTQGNLLGSAIPQVSIVKSGRYLPESDGETPESEVDILARIERNLQISPLAGFVGEGAAPFGGLTRSMDAALEYAVFSGMPVVKVGRGNAEGMVPVTPGTVFIAGSNLTANKARLLLMACLLKFGALPVAGEPARPTRAERAATQRQVTQYQEIFNTH
jgi:L-asparaginase